MTAPSETPAIWLFSYGSNDPERLTSRFGRPVTSGMWAKAKDRLLVFRGHSTRWQGGVGSLHQHVGAVAYGYITRVSEAELLILDAIECVPHAYERAYIDVETARGVRTCVCYVATSDEPVAPSAAYLAACRKTAEAFWGPLRDGVREPK